MWSTPFHRLVPGPHASPLFSDWVPTMMPMNNGPEPRTVTQAKLPPPSFWLLGYLITVTEMELEHRLLARRNNNPPVMTHEHTLESSHLAGLLLELFPAVFFQ